MKKNSGFTLIELIVVIALMSILTTISIVSFNSFNEAQVFKSSVHNVSAMLNTAKSKSLSQVKPDQCSSDKKLDGYQVVVSGSSYKLNAVCDGMAITPPVETKVLPAQLSFGSNKIVSFEVSTGKVISPVAIAINGFGKNSNIIVDSAGNISIQ